MQTVSTRILESFKSAPEGRVFSAKECLHLGSRQAVDQAFSRLTREESLIRVGRGRYVLPIQTRFGKRAPSAERIVESIAASSGEVIAPSGAAAANELGLTTQVPVRSVFLTSGRSRSLRIGRQVVELRHAPGWQLRSFKQPSGKAVRALTWLGRTHASEAMHALWKTLPESEQENLLAARASLPEWLALIVSEVVSSANSQT